MKRRAGKSPVRVAQGLKGCRFALDGHHVVLLVQQGVVQLELLGLTVLEELGGHLREQGVGEHVLFLGDVLADLLAVLLQFRRDVVGGAMGDDLASPMTLRRTSSFTGAGRRPYSPRIRPWDSLGLSL